MRKPDAARTRKRDAVARAVFEKTHGHCHFCGDKVVLENYGTKRKPYPDGAWELDHVIQRKKGGDSEVHNYLPACKQCNHLRWHRSGEQLREIIFLGLIAQDEIERGTEFGRQAKKLQAKRLVQNERRRKTNGGKFRGDS